MIDLEQPNVTAVRTICKYQREGYVCPVGGNCADKNAVYKATVTTRSASDYHTAKLSRPDIRSITIMILSKEPGRGHI